MSEEELISLQEIIERKIQLAEVTGGLTTTDKSFINLWNYMIELRERIDKAIPLLCDSDSLIMKKEYANANFRIHKAKEILKGGSNE